MRLGVVVDDLWAEAPQEDASGLALTALRLGHDAWIMSAPSLRCLADGSIVASGLSAPYVPGASTADFLRIVQADQTRPQPITLDAFDAILLRTDPSDTSARTSGIRAATAAFAGLLAEHRVVVLNDPLRNVFAASKIYMQHLPEASRPAMLVSRDPQEIRAFAAEHGGRAVIKPTHGTKGRNVFLLRSDDDENGNQMIEAVAQEGQVIAQ
jgi:glutathione synthase